MAGFVSEMCKPVIGQEYCLPKTAEYTLVQTTRGCFTENWSVTDATDEAVVFTLAKHNVNSTGWIPKLETQLVDAQGNIIARFKQKGCGTWKVFAGDSHDVLCSADDCCCLINGKTGLKVFLASSLSKKHPDYTINFKNFFWQKDYIIFHGTQSLGEVSVKCRILGRPTYKVTVNAGADCAFVLLLVMIMEKRAKKHKAHAAASGG